ncbi:hypothetical protein Bca101_082585 [Brassica carinata]
MTSPLANSLFVLPACCQSFMWKFGYIRFVISSHYDDNTLVGCLCHTPSSGRGLFHCLYHRHMHFLLVALLL